MLPIIINKPKIREGYSYVLKTSTLQKAISDCKLQTSVHLQFRTPNNKELINWPLIEAVYWFPNQNVNYSRFYIEVAAVPISLKQQASFLVNTGVIFKLIDWMVQQEKLDIQSTLLQPRFKAIIKNGELSIS